ncbi:VOC family protein [Streptomyces sp. NPDC050418]|uniref:VOC family protein n=1 Tax=Streptomyces sp. NPDC050418 TaxID=3365612 RepID=UPI0037A39E11
MAAYPRGVPCWADALLPDVEAGKRFYGELFGWTFDEGAGPAHGHYVQAYKEGKAVAALAPKQDGRMPTVWNVYLATPDAPATARAVKEAGGGLVMEPMPIGRFGTMALATDPEGAVFGLWQGGTHEGFELSGAPGAFCWTEVYVRDAGRADTFYEEVFGFEGFDLGGVIKGFRTWSPAGTAPGPDTSVGGRQLMGEGYPAMLPAHFLVYFAVGDCDEAARTAARLGGRVQSPPVDIPYGRIATLVDNQGASFAVLQDLAE